MCVLIIWLFKLANSPCSSQPNLKSGPNLSHILSQVSLYSLATVWQIREKVHTLAHMKSKILRRCL